MSFTRPGLSLGILCTSVMICAGPASTQTLNAIPDFSGQWARTGMERGSFDPPPDGGPGPIMTDQRYPRRFPASPEASEKMVRIVDGWIPDLTNPILQPHTRELLSVIADEELAGLPHPQTQTMCLPPGVPHISNLFDNMQVLQMPDEVVFMYSRNSHARHVYLNQPHHAEPGHSWWGDSVGHYEGDTLVVDTYGLTDQTEVDRFGTTHSNKMHVVERFRMSNDGSTLELSFTVVDHEAFTVPWSARADYTTTNRLWLETICPENAERAYWPGRPIYFPTDETPDF